MATRETELNEDTNATLAHGPQENAQNQQKQEREIAQQNIDKIIAHLEQVSPQTQDIKDLISGLQGLANDIAIGAVPAASATAILSGLQNKADQEITEAEVNESLYNLQIVSANASVYDLSPEAQENIRIRSAPLDINNAQQLHQFAETFLGDEVPKELREPAATAVGKRLSGADLAAMRAIYNAAPSKIRTEVNTEEEQTKAALHKTASDPHSPDNGVCTELELTGGSANPKVRHTLDDKEHHRITPAQAHQQLEQAGVSQRASLVDTVPQALTAVSSDVAAAAKHLGSNEQIIQAALDAFHKRAKDSKCELTTGDQAAIQVFLVSRAQVMFTEMAQDVQQRQLDLSMGKGVTVGSKDYQADLAQRVGRAEAAIGKDSAFDKIPQATRDQMLTATLAGMDQAHILPSAMNKASSSQINAISLEAYQATDWGHKVETAKNIMSKMWDQFTDTNTADTDKTSENFGRGIKNTLEAVHVGSLQASAGVSQALGHEATDLAKEGAASKKMLFGMVTGNLGEIKSAASDALNVGKDATKDLTHSAVIYKNEDKDITNILGAVYKDDLAKMTYKDAQGQTHKMLNLTGDATKDVAAIKDALNKANVSLATFDNGDGHIDSGELGRALQQVAQFEHATLDTAKTPDATPASAKPQAQHAH